MVKNVGKNAIIVNDEIIKNGESAILRRESELIIGGEPIIVTSFESSNFPSHKEGFMSEQRDEGAGTQGFNLKDCLILYYRSKKTFE